MPAIKVRPRVPSITHLVPSNRLVLDTDIVIHLLKKNPEVVAKFLALKETKTLFLISPVVVAEIYAGAFLHEHKDIEAFFDLCLRIDIDSKTGRTAGQFAHRFRKSFSGISLEDYLIAATASTHTCAIWTGNRKHYPMPEVLFFE